MIKSVDEMQHRIEIDLTGPDGNAFILLGKATKLANKLGKDAPSIEPGQIVIRERFNQNVSA